MWTELRTKAYPSEKAITERRNNLASYLIYRPVSWPITWLSYKIGLSPNQITGLGLLFTLLGLIRLAWHPDAWGALFLNLAYILDQVDGNIARLTGQASTAGLWLDSLVGFLYSTFYLAALAIGLYLTPSIGTSGFLESILSSEAVLMLGLVGSGAITTRKMAVKIAAEQSLEEPSEGLQFSQKAGLFLLPKTLNSFAIILLLLAILLGLQIEYLLFYSVYQISLCLVVCFITYRRLNRT